MNNTDKTIRVRATIFGKVAKFDYDFDCYPGMKYSDSLIAKYGNQSRFVMQHWNEAVYEVIG